MAKETEAHRLSLQGRGVVPELAWDVSLTYSVTMVGLNTLGPPPIEAQQSRSRSDELVHVRWLCLIAVAAPVISVLTYFALRSAVT